MPIVNRLSNSTFTGMLGALIYADAKREDDMSSQRAAPHSLHLIQQMFIEHLLCAPYNSRDGWIYI